jgi:hypothetical protein
MNKKTIPQFTPGEKAFSRGGMPVTIVKWPVFYGKTPLVEVRIHNEYRDICAWFPEWIVKKGQTIPLFWEAE